MFNAAVRQDDRQSSDIISCHPVFDGTHAAGIGVDVAADGGRLFSRIRRIEEVTFFDISL